MSYDDADRATRAKQLAALAQHFDFSTVLAVHGRDYGVPTSLQQAQLRELVRFLVARVVCAGEHLGMKGSIDHLWHCFILCTQDYFAFSRVLGVEYLHHDPCYAGGGGDDAYARFLAVYEELFDEEPPAVHWPAHDQAPVRLATEWVRISHAL